MSFLYRALLRVCPAEVRDGHGEEMVRIARHCIEVEAARHGVAGRIAGEVRALADLAVFAVGARRDARRRRSWSVTPAQPVSRRPIIMMRDIRSALRRMRARPLFSAAVVLMLALGIGATTAIFSVVDGVLLTPLSIPHPDRILEVWGAIPSRSIDQVSWAEANTWDLHDLNHSFSEFGSVHPASFSLTSGGEPDRVQGALVSVGFLRALGVSPVAGRFFDTGEDDAGAPAERVVLSEKLWASRFNRDPKIINSSIMLDGKPYTVIGISPDGPVWLGSRDVFVPLLRRADADRGSWEYTVIGRLAPGVTAAAAQADLGGVMKTLSHYKDNEGIGIVVNGTEGWMASPELRRTLWIMLGAVFLLLVIASVNVTNLLFVRASALARERAVRTALGASRGDLIRENLTESILLSLLGGLAGWGIAAAMLAVFKAQDPGGIPRLATVTLDRTVLMFALGVSFLVGGLTGLVPSMRVPFSNLVTALREGQRGSVGDRRQDRTRSLFVALEVAVSVLLLVGAALMVRSLHNVLNADRGFATANRLTAEISMPGAYPVERRMALAKQILERVGAMPEIQSVAAVSGAMLVGGGTGMSFASANSTAEGDKAPWATWRLITKDYFPTIGLNLLAGRAFTENDKIGKPWRVVISDRLAKRIWPGENPVGKTATLWKGQSNDSAEVVGVVSDMREHRLDDDPTLTVYLPAYDGPLANTTLRLVMHTRGKPDDAGPALRAVVKSIDASLPVSRIRSVEALVTSSVATRRFTMALLATFAGFAALLALAGVAGVLAYSMSRRRSEMGLRLALGARHGQLLALAMRVGLVPVAIGLAAGIGIALWLSRLLTGLLYGVQSWDPLTYAGVAAALLAAAALACYLPARMVVDVDPASVMRID
jgi:putative ABC transport system permease protein